MSGQASVPTMQSDNIMEPQQSDRLIGGREIDGTIKDGTCRSVCTSPSPSNPESLFTASLKTQRRPDGEATMMIEEQDTCPTPAS